MKMNDAISRVQRHDVPEGRLHPAYKHEDHHLPSIASMKCFAKLALRSNRGQLQLLEK
jgi:hypothetical protein